MAAARAIPADVAEDLRQIALISANNTLRLLSEFESPMQAAFASLYDFIRDSDFEFLHLLMSDDDRCLTAQFTSRNGESIWVGMVVNPKLARAVPITSGPHKGFGTPGVRSKIMTGLLQQHDELITRPWPEGIQTWMVIPTAPKN